jgi:hypothetical protein
MNRKTILLSALLASMSLSGNLALAADPPPAGQEQIYGSQLMTEQERADYRARMRSTTSNDERERIRMEHHQQMKARAAKEGKTLPDEPPASRGGMMPPAGGMGPGSTR